MLTNRILVNVFLTVDELKGGDPKLQTESKSKKKKKIYNKNYFLKIGHKFIFSVTPSNHIPVENFKQNQNRMIRTKVKSKIMFSAFYDLLVKIVCL